MYEEYFGLLGKPFQLTPDSSFFFPSREHQRALSFLEYGLDQADGFVVVTGDVGTGKTTLVQTLLKKLDPKKLLVANIVTTQLNDDDLLHLVAASFGLRVSNPSKAILLQELERMFLQQTREGRRVLIVVDEAQNLPPGTVEELRMLSNFQRDGQPLVQIFLLGQQEFRATLLGPGFEQLRQRILATYHLKPLDAKETRTYIEHRLRRVGWDNDPILFDEAFEAIFNFSGGVPRRINNLCDRLLLYAYLEEQHRIDAALVKTVSEEIGAEMWSGRPEPARQPDPAASMSEDSYGSPAPLETMARVMFDKANVQQRLAALERGIDGLGQSIKPELSELRAELLEVRTLIEDLVAELREQRQLTSLPED